MTKRKETSLIAVNSRNEPKIFRELLHALEKPHRSTETDLIIEEFVAQQNISGSGARRIRSRAFKEGIREIGLKWKGPSSRSQKHLYSSLRDEEINPLEVATAFHPKSYLCYQTALFWNELTEQVPQTFYIGQERPETSSKAQIPVNFDDFELRDAFVKVPVEHKTVGMFGQYRYIILVRAYTGNAGVEERKIPFNGKKITASITGLERTLLDCISVPENAGGISNVIEATRLAAEKIDIDLLFDLYTKLRFKYPHWQRVGLLFDRLGYTDLEKKWKNRFGSPKNKFFLTKGYKLEWEFDDAWSIYFPRGLFK
jgi:predicted transcriptional regulator of viral defense system